MLGKSDGMPEGSDPNSRTDGDDEKFLVGCSLGNCVGEMLCTSDGSSLGTLDGLSLCAIDGLALGFSLGGLLGLELGMCEGQSDGPKLGYFVGD